MSRKIVAPTLKSALLYFDQRYSGSAADRAHIKRWLDEVDDPVWEKIASDIRLYGELPTSLVEGPYSSFIGSALRARVSAEKADSPSMQKDRNQRREHQERVDCFEYALIIEDVARLYPKFRLRLDLSGPPDPDNEQSRSIEELEALNSLEWLARKAMQLRHLAEGSTNDESKFESDNWAAPVRVSRQSYGKKQRGRSRQVGVFIQEMVNCLYRSCGKPRYQAVAIMTNIAFPGANVDPEDVRSVCRPTTRVGRRRKTGALGR